MRVCQNDMSILTPEIVISPESPHPAALLDWLDVVVDPSVRYRATLMLHLQPLEKRFELHYCSVMMQNAGETGWLSMAQQWY